MSDWLNIYKLCEAQSSKPSSLNHLIILCTVVAGIFKVLEVHFSEIVTQFLSQIDESMHISTSKRPSLSASFNIQLCCSPLAN